MNYFIADLHFGHQNALAYDNRPFKTIEEHDNIIIKNWNDTVGIDDDVYILGDISWYNVTRTIEIIHSLNGIKHLIMGNHDAKLIKNKDLQKEFVEFTNYKELSYNDKGIILCHYPMPCFKNHFHGWYHFYGHVHTSFEENMMQHDKFLMEELYQVPCNMYNVGCMTELIKFTPRTAEEIINSGKK